MIVSLGASGKPDRAAAGDHEAAKGESAYMSIATIIVNYQAGALILSHLERVLAEMRTVPGSNLFVVDNASPNGDAALLAEGLAGIDDAHFIAAPENGGFSYGNNVALKRALPQGFDHYLLLNPDAYPAPGYMVTLSDFLRTHPQVGIVGSRLEGEDGHVQCSAFRAMSALGELENAAQTGPVTRLLQRAVVAPLPADQAHPTDWVSGASMMIKREVFERIGLMDEDYFLYYEETDFQYAAKKAGFEIWYVPEARAVHLVGQSTDFDDERQQQGALPAYWFDSRHRYFRKNRGAAYAVLADAAFVVGKSISALRGLLSGRGAGAEIRAVRSVLAARKRARGQAQSATQIKAV